MSNKACQKFVKAERGEAQGLAWTFADKETLKPTLYAYKHPQLGPNEVRVRVLYFGVADQDIKVLKSKDVEVLVPGHEIVGVVEAIGETVGMRKVGDFVGVGLIKNSCKNCKVCFGGKEELCKNVQNPWSGFGGFGTHIQVSADWTFPIPSNIPLSQCAPLFSSGVIAFNIVSGEYERLKHLLKRKPRIGVIGAGAVGHMIAKFASHFGYEVTIFSHTADKEQLLKDNGINFEQFFVESLENFKKNELKFDVVVVSGDISKQLSKESIQLARRNGKLILVSQLSGEVGVKGFSLVVDQKQVSGIRTGTKDNFYKMLELVAHVTNEQNKSLLPVCEHFTFSQFESALEKAKSGTAKFRPVVQVDEDIVAKYNKNEI